MDRLLLRDVRPLGGAAVDLLVGDGRILEVGEGLAAPEGATVVDGRGQLALPGLVDAHAHLDKTLWGLPWRAHTAGDGLAALIENEHRGRAELARSGCRWPSGPATCWAPMWPPAPATSAATSTSTRWPAWTA